MKGKHGNISTDRRKKIEEEKRKYKNG